MSPLEVSSSSSMVMLGSPLTAFMAIAWAAWAAALPGCGAFAGLGLYRFADGGAAPEGIGGGG